MDPISVVAISGSLREASFNKGLLRAFADEAPPELEVSFHDLRGLPMYDADLEREGDPESVLALRDAVRAADVLLFASPEYNGGIAGTLKNAIDWASRGDDPIRGKPCAVIGGGGRLATAQSQLMLRHVLSWMGCPLLPRPTLLVPRIADAFEDGVLVDPAIVARLRDLGSAIVEWMNKLR